MRIQLDVIMQELPPEIEAEINRRISGKTTLNELYDLAQELRERAEQPYHFKDILQIVAVQSMYHLGHLG